MEFLSDHAGLIAILLMFTLMLLSVPVFVATGVGALIGFLLIRDPDQAVHDMGDIVWAGAAIYELVALPLFIFTGLLMQRIGAGEDLFNVTRAWVGASRNSLGVATILACGIFAAICGSSIATAATVGIVAIPLLLGDRYTEAQAGGFVAGGGTLGIIVPPSIPMILYGVLTETSIGRLFLAGIVPGLIMMTLFIIYVLFSRPIIRRSHDMSFAEKLAITWHGLPVLLLPVIIIGSIYAGLFTPTEVAALAILYVVIVGALQRRLTSPHLLRSRSRSDKDRVDAFHADRVRRISVAFPHLCGASKKRRGLHHDVVLGTADDRHSDDAGLSCARELSRDGRDVAGIGAAVLSDCPHHRHGSGGVWCLRLHSHGDFANTSADRRQSLYHSWYF